MATLHADPAEERRRRRSESHRDTTYGTFLNELCANSGLARDRAEQAAVSVLCILTQRIQQGEAGNLEAQLPAKLRELVQTCDRHLDMKPSKVRRAEFITMVADDLSVPPQEAELIARNVLSTVRQHISDGEAGQVEQELPRDMRDLWWLPF